MGVLGRGYIQFDTCIICLELFFKLFTFSWKSSAQEYDVTKRVEHFYKSLKYDGNAISSVDPTLYAKRFRSFIFSTFPEPVEPTSLLRQMVDDDP